MNPKRMLLAGVAVAALVAGPALAQSPEDPRAAQIRALEAQLDQLRAQVEDLKASVAADTSEIRRTAAAQPQVSVSNARPNITAPDQSARFAVRAVFQYDAARYNQDAPALPDLRRADTASASDLNSGSNFRRARIGVEGQLAPDWTYGLTGEFGGSGVESAQLNQAFLEYSGIRLAESMAPLRIRVGAWATAANLEDATSNTESLFAERPAAAELARSLAGGDGRTGIGVFANGDRWSANAVLTGATLGNSGEFDEQTGYLVRASYLALRGETYGLHLGLNASGVLDPADTDAGPGDQQRLRLRERAEIRVDGTRFVDTGNIAASGITQTGVEAGGFWNNLYLSGEYFHFDLDRTGAGTDPAFSGWYVQGAWTLTGERRRWNSAAGGFQGIRPANPFSLSGGKWGAWEVAARYSVLDLNSEAGAPGSAAVAGTTVRGGEQTVSTIGLSWYPTANIRLSLARLAVDVDRLDPENGEVSGTTVFGGALSVPGNGSQIGQSFDALTLRTQVAF
jgi:phosphate-selective porin OprO and OprP